jgi:hypothetical protein
LQRRRLSDAGLGRFSDDGSAGYPEAVIPPARDILGISLPNQIDLRKLLRKIGTRRFHQLLDARQARRRCGLRETGSDGRPRVLRGYLPRRESCRSITTSTSCPAPRESLKSQQHSAGSNAALCGADGKRLPFHDGTFDLVVCLYGLHHFCGYLGASQEIARVLKPRGTFALIDPIRRADKPSQGGITARRL